MALKESCSPVGRFPGLRALLQVSRLRYLKATTPHCVVAMGLIRLTGMGNLSISLIREGWAICSLIFQYFRPSNSVRSVIRRDDSFMDRVSTSGILPCTRTHL